MEDEDSSHKPTQERDSSIVNISDDSVVSVLDTGHDASVEELPPSPLKQTSALDSSVEILDTSNETIDSNGTILIDTTVSSVGADTISHDDKSEQKRSTVSSDREKKDTTEVMPSEEKKDLGCYPENPFPKDMITIDTAGDSSKTDVKDSEEETTDSNGTILIDTTVSSIGADNITQDIDTDESGQKSSTVSSDKEEGDATEVTSSEEKEDLGCYPKNPYLKDMIMIDTAGDSSKTDVKDSEEVTSSEEKELVCYPENPYLKDMIIVDTTGEPDPDINAAEDTGDGIEFIEGVSIDLEGNRNTPSNGQNDFLEYPVHEIPSYNTEMSGVLADVEYSMETGKKINEARPKKSCFNCLGDHNVTECPEPADPRRIAANRKKQLGNRSSNVRYHEDSDNKYGQFQPGKISDNLRHALGLRHNELPIHIYRMRCLGYPPGWLKEAEVRQADMKLYDATGKSVTHPDREEGEDEPTLVKYNPDKLVSFPGFNVPIPKGFYDDYQQYGFPTMQRHHKKSEFRRFMELNRAGAYKKRKLKNESFQSSEANDSKSSVMDIEDSGINSSTEIEFNPPLPEEPMPPLPPGDESSISPKRLLEVEDGEIGEDSQLSVGFLEAKRQALLKELEDSGNMSEDIQEEQGVAPNNVEENEKESSTSLTEDSENSQCSGKEDQNAKLVKHHRSHSKSIKLGASIPPSITPFATLPDPDKWAVEVTDHINFENLPDALGTWSKMKGLMSHVKKRMHVLHADDE